VYKLVPAKFWFTVVWYSDFASVDFRCGRLLLSVAANPWTSVTFDEVGKMIVLYKNPSILGRCEHIQLTDIDCYNLLSILWTYA